MHFITYSKEELSILYEILKGTIEKDTTTIYRDIQNIRTNIYWFYFSYPFKIYEDAYKRLYEAIKSHISQFPLEVMYHYPLTKILLLMNHRNELVKSIVSWRIQISK
jgi:hypothetical protein